MCTVGRGVCTVGRVVCTIGRVGGYRRERGVYCREWACTVGSGCVL